MQETTTGLTPLDTLLGGSLPPRAVITLSGTPASGKQCIAAFYALARERCCWVSPIDDRPYLPPLLADRWAGAVASGQIVPFNPELPDDEPGSFLPLFRSLIDAGHRCFVILHTETLGHLTSASECVRLVYMLRKAGCEALLVAEEPNSPANSAGRRTTHDWEALADIQLRSEFEHEGTLPNHRLSVLRPPSPEMVIPPLRFEITRDGLRFPTDKRKFQRDDAAPANGPRVRTTKRRPVCRVLPELFYLDEAQRQSIRMRVEEINGRQNLVNYQIPPAPFADNLDYYQTLENFCRGEQVEDLFIIDIYRLRECIEKGLIQPLDQLVDTQWRNRFLPQALETCTYKGQLWAIPHWMNAGVLIYRRDLLEKHGRTPPRTFNQLVETAQVVLSAEGRDPRDGFGFQGAVAEALSCCFLEFLWNHGGDIYTGDLKPRIHEKPALAALQFIHDLVHEFKIAPHETPSLTETGTANLFLNDRLLFMRKWPNFLCVTSPEDRLPSPDCIAMAPLPTLRANMTPQAVLGGFAYVLPSQVIDPEPALAFHSRFHDEEGIRQSALTGWCCSPYREVYTDEAVLKGRPWIADLPAILATGRSRQDLPSYHRVTTLLREEVNLVLRRLRSPAEALEFIASRLEAEVLRHADANRLQDVIDYLKENLHLELSREDIAARCNLNPSYFSSLFKEVTGETFRRFVNRERIRKAQRLLVTSEQSAGEIARSVGFTDPSYFSQVFREYIGMTPIEHRSQARRRVGHH